MSLVSGYANTMSAGDMYSSYYNPPASTMQPMENGQNFYNAWAWNSPNVHQNPELSSTGHEFANSPPLSGSYTSGSPYGSPCQCIGPCQGHEYANSNGSTTSTVTYETFPGGTRVRVVKRRNTANKKERRRTMSINNAFTDLRDCIPNVPSDTKLSKIKTLRLATSYISYLMGVLEAGSQAETPFRAEIGRTKSDRNKESRNQQEDSSSSNSPSSRRSISAEAAMANDSKRSKGRTGWPHHVWALELKQ